MKLLIRILMIVLFSGGVLQPNFADTSATSTNTMAGFGDPYTRSEFPGWLLDLRRGETIFFGALPIFFLFSGLGYDYYYYYGVSGQNPSYTPWPMGPGTSQWTTTSNPGQLSDKTKTLLMASVAAAAFVAVLDWFIGKVTQ